MSEAALEIQKALENSVIELEPLLRGKGSVPGVPDSVIWVRPKDLPLPGCIPLLFELENKGSFSDADRDAIEFGKRHDNLNRPDQDEWEYTLRWPTLDWQAPTNFVVPVTYELLGVSAPTIVTAERDVQEHQFHREVRRFYREKENAVRTTDVQIRAFNDTEVVFWRLEANILGSYTRDVVIPCVTSFGSDFGTLVTQRFPEISLPMTVCVGGDGATRTKTLTQETGVEFRLLPNIYG